MVGITLRHNRGSTMFHRLSISILGWMAATLERWAVAWSAAYDWQTLGRQEVARNASRDLLLYQLLRRCGRCAEVHKELLVTMDMIVRRWWSDYSLQ